MNHLLDALLIGSVIMVVLAGVVLALFAAGLYSGWKEDCEQRAKVKRLQDADVVHYNSEFARPPATKLVWNRTDKFQ